MNTTVSFMELRAQRLRRLGAAELVRDSDIPDVTETTLHASHVCTDDARLAIGLQVPSCQWEYVPPLADDGPWCVWFLDPATRSWARFDWRPDADGGYPVSQFGSRRLWDEVVVAYEWWMQAGQPTARDWRFTVKPDGHHIDLEAARQPGTLAAVSQR